MLILISWLLHLELQCFSVNYISGFIMFSKEFIYGFSTGRARLSSFLHYLFFGTCEIFFGQVHYDHLRKFSTKTSVVGTQKNSLNETVLLRTQNPYLNY